MRILAQFEIEKIPQRDNARGRQQRWQQHHIIDEGGDDGEADPDRPVGILKGRAEGRGGIRPVPALVVGAFEPLADGARSETAYRALFGVLTVVLIVAVAIYSRSQDVKPSDQMRDSR